MPKFKALQAGINEDLIAKTTEKVEKYLNELFHEYEIVKIDELYTFTFGTVTVNIDILPWHSEDVLVRVYAYIGSEESIDNDLASKLLDINAKAVLGAFGVTFDGQPLFSYSLAGANLDLNEFKAAVQMVAMTADEYDDNFKQEAAAS